MSPATPYERILAVRGSRVKTSNDYTRSAPPNGGRFSAVVMAPGHITLKERIGKGHDHRAGRTTRGSKARIPGGAGSRLAVPTGDRIYPADRALPISTAGIDERRKACNASRYTSMPFREYRRYPSRRS
jgi:hypothetical protein